MLPKSIASNAYSPAADETVCTKQKIFLFFEHRPKPFGQLAAGIHTECAVTFLLHILLIFILCISPYQKTLFHVYSDQFAQNARRHMADGQKTPLHTKRYAGA